VPTHPRDRVEISRYVDLTRAEWARLRASTPLPLSEAQLRPLGGLIERVSLDEVSDVYLPLSRLLNLYVGATQKLRTATGTFLGGSPDLRIPYIIGVAGSVAVGKSTTSRVLKALLSHWPSHPRVDLVTTDGFLIPQRELEARGLAHRKGFPESYNVRLLLRFLADVKSGLPEVTAPVYSHLAYDIVPGECQAIRQPDILIVEGLNVLQTGSQRKKSPTMFVSDFFDFSIYVDANESDIEQWYIERFLKLRATVFQNPSSYFHRYASLTNGEAESTARRIWEAINLVNLHQNVLPTRERAHLVLEKGRDHAVRRVRLRMV
jgi:type I pantothenate kinase